MRNVRAMSRAAMFAALMALCAWIALPVPPVAFTMQTFALLLTLGNLPRAMAAAAVNLLPWGLFLFQYELFWKASFLWLSLYFAAAAYINTSILWKVFKPFYPEET